MDPLSSDDECFSEQLDCSNMAPSAKTVIYYQRLYLRICAEPLSSQTALQQRFTMRRYNIDSDGRLTNLAKAME